MWREILVEYDQKHRENHQREIEWFRQQPSLRMAIELAARAQDHRGLRYGHQRRIWKTAIAQAIPALLSIEASIARSKSFDSLLALISGQLRSIAGTGPLYEYDAAFRIGAHLGAFPTKVYLHSETREGARALQISSGTKEALEMDEVPAELRHRAPHEIENILCLCRHRLQGGASHHRSAESRC